MKRIGLLGGMSWESSAEYYRLVNEATRDRLGGLHSADCLMRSVDFAADRAAPARGPLGGGGRACWPRRRGALVAAGAELIVLCTNTMHKVADAITAAIDVPFVHIADTTAAAVRAAGLDDGRPAGDGVHDGAGLLRRPPARPARPRGARARRGDRTIVHA